MATFKLTNTKEKKEAEPKFQVLTPFQLAWRRFRKNKLALIGTVVVFLFLFIAIFAPVISPYPYDKTSYNVFVAPGKMPQYILGTDDAGRDFLSRLIWGANTSLTVGLSVQVFALAVGLILGIMAAWFGGFIDFIVNRLLEIFGSMPGLLFQILIMTMLGNGVMNVTFAIAILAWPGMVRLVRAQVLSIKDLEYVEASRSMGASGTFIAWYHVVPNILNPLLVSISFGIPGFMIAEAGLSFLGHGINDPVPSWGKMLADAGKYVQSFVYLGIIPTILLMVVFIGFSFFGDGVRDALDPSSDRIG
jgi:ABC-type dipeptide/oligopeptide/nickel transport system permease subunit